MSNDFFHFKQFSIYQDRCAMKVGTDGVLLGAWVEIGDEKRILDIGTGTGLIALMLAQRSNAFIDAIEIEKAAAEQAKGNIFNSPWANRVTVRAVSLQEYFPDTFFDLIVSNPPYFTNSQQNPGSKRELARHTHALSPFELIEGICRLIQQNGRFALIYPADSFDVIKDMACARGFSAKRITRILPTPNSIARRILAEFSFSNNETDYDEIIIEENGRYQYSQKFKELTGEFYLNNN
jgi:tRNA1Val (adenine37-N6)-methyltransferase